MISLEQLTEFFSDTRELHKEGRTSWSIDGECCWSYFFVNSTRENLVPLADHLETLGYEVIAIDESEDESEYFLQVDKIQAHTPESLFELGKTFDQLAEQYNVDDYDGMDVGSINGDE
jgi:hypothetical protein